MLPMSDFHPGLPWAETLSCCPLLVLSPFCIVLVKHCRPCLAHGKYPVNTHLLIRTALGLEDKMDFNSQRAGGRGIPDKRNSMSQVMET